MPTDKSLQFHLASSSPRRAEILRHLGFRFSAQGVDLDERRFANEGAEEMVLRLAAEKAAAANVEVSQPVLGSDTAVVLGAEILGKPSDIDDGIRMLLSLSGRTHTVLTAVALKIGDKSTSILSKTDVRFREIERDEAVLYWHSGEPQDKAGAYGIQGLGGVFVETMRGSYSGVMGLPVFETAQLLAAAGIYVLRRHTTGTT